VRLFVPRIRDERSLSSVMCVERFIRQFELTYGTQHPVFFEGSYRQALETGKQELRFVLVYLQSSEHDDTPRFNR
jgi:FAS-associated factor 2